MESNLEGSVRLASRLGKLPTTRRLRGEATKKRLFDLMLTAVAGLAWVPLLVACALVVLLTSGWPCFYVSSRRVDRRRTIRLYKLRAMVRNADRIANRDTVPIEGTRFLNMDFDSPLYTRAGRVLERFNLTELPQLFHVLAGQMSLVGSRPLPERVIEALRQAHPEVEQRFRTKAGVAGPIQLVGRGNVSDAQRLEIENRYCRIAETSYSARLDFLILASVVLMALRLKKLMSPDDVLRMMERYDRSVAPDLHPGDIVRPAAEAPAPVAVTQVASLGANGNGNGNGTTPSAGSLGESGVVRTTPRDPVAS
jgi:lipopolysaccharide/colanic/teichoic acid biosynthesis glycosyltransferase